ncbi:hypothetical protein [Tumidithrix helvetica]|uniref:hypothetical protein n=1 Tax=Tumidithrix helvetica TaxID=3457545 RepID=UPI003CC60752
MAHLKAFFPFSNQNPKKTETSLHGFACYGSWRRNFAIACLVGLTSIVSGFDRAFANPSQWSTFSTPTPIAQADIEDRENFRPKDLSQIEVIIGEKPGVLVMGAFGSAEAGEGARSEESLQIRFLGFDRAIALLTRTGGGDDSVSGLRYRIELVKQKNQLWRIIWVGTQTKCQPERGHQDWSSQLCS